MAPTFPDFGVRSTGVFLFDGGFGGKGLRTPTSRRWTSTVPTPTQHGFGNGTFSTPPVIEAADTLPVFHTQRLRRWRQHRERWSRSTRRRFFLRPRRPAAELDARFSGQPVVITGDDITNIGRFLRALNVALNLDMAKQRLRAAQTILNRFRDRHADIQKQLIRLADAELDDALAVLTSTVRRSRSIR